MILSWHLRLGSDILIIIEAQKEHFEAIWNIFHGVVKGGDTYVYPAETTKEEFQNIWFHKTMRTFVALKNNNVVGTYIIKPNFPGFGAHIANCSYMVGDTARGLGVGKAMGEHSIAFAKEQGYRGMQFNIVVSTNTAAVRLWQSLGFDIIGTTPKGFRDKKLGFVDAYIMYRGL